MSLESRLLDAIETHSVHDIRATLGAGISAVEPIEGFTPIEYLTSGYLRSDRFADCLRELMNAGASLSDTAVKAALLDDEMALEAMLQSSGTGLLHRTIHLRAAFTSCLGVTLLHLCAEFNSSRCARVLLDAGADVNARADIDADGFGGHSPVFHAVNSIHNYCRPVMELLVERGATLDVRVAGLLWGQNMDWETVVVDATPLSYAQCGLYRQFHRREVDVYSNLTYLYERRYGHLLRVPNVPNRYLA